ncbi:SanA/YdcF family protein [Phytoactinopolyspora halotolerans]|uniref:YdcF family protein n=1 Tax=Phytoactinopolyspora halotolerans TaxID=1981512 RepID=A0A6L9S7U7_9ACTN|nr:ElyC/SanA/YdcF family protein [Phytoactinopolyspora halotolerans]NEE01107.1 YdcF family protein [Phytoactinopolyspora halotolerans]
MVVVLASSICVPSAWSYAKSWGRIVNVGSAPSAPVAMVLGAGVRPDGQPSQLLAGRLDVAAELYATGRVDTLLVSGATGMGGYDEPGAMRDYLIDAGVPASAIRLDDLGNSTWESCERAHDEFRYNDLLVVSQRFHLPRAVALCRAAGIDAHGVAHESGRTNPRGTRTGYAREVLASVPALWTAITSKV